MCIRDSLRFLQAAALPLLKAVSPASLLVRISPVSYTHLDVYKRQIKRLCCRRIGLQLQDLHRFREDQLSIHTFLRHVTDHAVSSEQFPQFREGTGATVTDVVIFVIAKGRCV